VVLLPGCPCCGKCGFDQGVSVECDITSTPAYGYLQKKISPTSTGETYQTVVMAWSIPTPTVSLASIAGPTSEGQFYHYCWGNAKTPIRDSSYRVTGGADFPCSNYSTTPLLSSFIIRARLCKRELSGGSFTDARLTVSSGGPRLMAKRGTSNVPPLDSAIALSDGWIDAAIASGWEVWPAENHYASLTNVTERVMIQNCSIASGKSAPFTQFSPNTASDYRPFGNIGPTLSSGALPISIRDSYSISVNDFLGESLIATTLPVSPRWLNWYYLDFRMSVDAVRLLFSSSDIPVFS